MRSGINADSSLTYDSWYIVEWGKSLGVVKIKFHSRSKSRNL